MLAQFAHFFKHRRQKKAAIDAAIRHFERAGNHQAHRNICSVLHADELGFVVRIYYGENVIPPNRAWFRVLPDMTDIQELSYDEVEKYGESYSK